jgi:hypothetical protein
MKFGVAVVLMALSGGIASAQFDPGIVDSVNFGGVGATVPTSPKEQAAPPIYHDVNQVWLRLFLDGVFGSPDYPFWGWPGLVYPRVSSSPVYLHNYLAEGGLWIGGVPEGESAIVVSNRYGWGGCLVFTGLKTTVNYTETLIGDTQVYYTVYADSFYGLEVLQNSYAFRYNPYQDFIIFILKIVNFSPKVLKDVYLGIYFNGPGPGVEGEELCGFRRLTGGDYGDTINLAWVADNDGNPQGTIYTEDSPTAAVGVKILKPRSGECGTNFNWWLERSDLGYRPDWGPTLQSNFDTFGYLSDSGLGIPKTCAEKYYIMSNGEIDYDQYLSQLDHTSEGWLAPHPDSALDIANGFLSEFLISCGPLGNLNPGDTLDFAFAVIGGENFHNNPLAYDSTMPHLVFYDYTNLVNNALMAQRLYDSLFDPPTDVDDQEPVPLPKQFRLEQNYPNPFNAGTTIRYRLPKASSTTLGIYNLKGQLVRTLLNNKFQSPGEYQIIWDGKNGAGEKVCSGVYFYRLTSAVFTEAKKMVLLR